MNVLTEGQLKAGPSGWGIQAGGNQSMPGRTSCGRCVVDFDGRGSLPPGLVNTSTSLVFVCLSFPVVNC